ncbi:hypothetical protein ACEPAI_7031 [Sanghuangporus weigelae]
MTLQPDNQEQNPLMIQFYTWESRGSERTSWWKYFEQEVPRLKDLGVTHVWLPPMAKSATRKYCGYDVYDLWDLGEFDQKNSVATRWGTKGELTRACAVAKSHGVGIIVDAVLNHKVGADRKETFQAIPVDEKKRLIRKSPAKEIEAWTVYDFPGRQNKYSEMKWDHRHFSGVDWDARARTKEIYYIPGPGRNGWSKFVADELENYDYLLGCDIDHRQPDVKRDLFKWGTWIIEQTGAIGFRMDAMKHYDRRFLREFLDRTKKTTGKPNLFAVSEYWHGDIDVLEHYVDLLRGSTSFFDVPLHYNFHNASKQGPSFDLRHMFKNALVGRRPWEAVTFVDNHDALEIGQSLESWVYPGFKLQAYALILLRMDGFPCIFYGDLYPDNECYDPRIGPKLKLLIQARKNFAYGSTTDYFQYKDCIGFVRSGDARHPGCAVIIRSSIGTGEAMSETATSGVGTADDHNGKLEGAENIQGLRMKAPSSLRKKTSEAPVKYRDLLREDSNTVSVSNDGYALFPCPIGTVAIWVPEI